MWLKKSGSFLHLNVAAVETWLTVREKFPGNRRQQKNFHGPIGPHKRERISIGGKRQGSMVVRDKGRKGRGINSNEKEGVDSLYPMRLDELLW